MREPWKWNETHPSLLPPLLLHQARMFCQWYSNGICWPRPFPIRMTIAGGSKAQSQLIFCMQAFPIVLHIKVIVVVTDIIVLVYCRMLNKGIVIISRVHWHSTTSLLTLNSLRCGLPAARNCNKRLTGILYLAGRRYRRIKRCSPASNHYTNNC